MSDNDKIIMFGKMLSPGGMALVNSGFHKKYNIPYDHWVQWCSDCARNGIDPVLMFVGGREDIDIEEFENWYKEVCVPIYDRIYD